MQETSLSRKFRIFRSPCDWSTAILAIMFDDFSLLAFSPLSVFSNFPNRRVRLAFQRKFGKE